MLITDLQLMPRLRGVEQALADLVEARDAIDTLPNFNASTTQQRASLQRKIEDLEFHLLGR